MIARDDGDLPRPRRRERPSRSAGRGRVRRSRRRRVAGSAAADGSTPSSRTASCVDVTRRRSTARSPPSPPTARSTRSSRTSSRRRCSSRLLGTERFVVAAVREPTRLAPPTHACGPRRPASLAPRPAFAARFPELRPRRPLRRAPAHRVRPPRRRAATCTSTTPAAACTPRARSTPTPTCSAPRARQPALEQPDLAGVDRARASGPAAASSSSSTRRPTSTSASSPPTPAPRCAWSASRTGSRRAAPSPSPSTTTTRSTASASSPAARAPTIAYVPVVAPELRLDRAAMTARARRRPTRRPATCSPSRPSRTSPASSTRSTWSTRRTTRGWDVLRRRRRLRADEPARRRRASGPTSSTFSFYKIIGLPDRRRVPAGAPRPGRRPGPAVVRRRHDHHRLGAGRRPLPAPATRPASRTAPSTTSTCRPSTTGLRAPRAHRPRRDPRAGRAASPRGCSTR